MIVHYYKYDVGDIEPYNRDGEHSEQSSDNIIFMQKFANECGFYLEQEHLFDNHLLIKVKKI